MKFKSNIKSRGQQTKTHGLKPTNHLVLYSPWSKNAFFTFLKGWRKKRILFDMWKLYKIQISTSINKVLLEYSHTHLSMAAFVLQWQSWEVARETEWSTSLKYSLSDSLQKKFTDPFRNPHSTNFMEFGNYLWQTIFSKESYYNIFHSACSSTMHSCHSFTKRSLISFPLNLGSS